LRLVEAACLPIGRCQLLQWVWCRMVPVDVDEGQPDHHHDDRHNGRTHEPHCYGVPEADESTCPQHKEDRYNRQAKTIEVEYEKHRHHVAETSGVDGE